MSLPTEPLAALTGDDQEIHVCDQCWDIIRPADPAYRLPATPMRQEIEPYDYWHADCFMRRYANYVPIQRGGP